MVVEPLAGIRVIRHVREDVARLDLDALVGDLLRMNEHDFIDRLLQSDDDGTRQAVEIGARHQPHGTFLSLKLRINQDMTAEKSRLTGDAHALAQWRKWGPYLSDRAWGTVREDYSADGDAWSYLPHDLARSRAYRWNEDGQIGSAQV